MSLPPGFLDELRNRTSLAHVVGRKVMWDMRRSNQGKGDMWAPCPFHHEKTASFHVDDKKGFYHCFGCHAKGDAIGFVRETENVGFMEAVEILAREAGMPMPARDPAAQQKADRNAQLAEIMELAIAHFRLQLRRGAGAEARAYLDRRGLGEPALERFEIGFAPPGWEGLREHLLAKGVSVEDMLTVGLVKASDKGRAPYDVFRNRIMFPIRDGRGRAIAFGGRAMDPEDRAKYLNSPETPLFDKSRNLYNLRAAREAAGKGQTLVVAEGYMDVIALSEAGFAAAVAPLGTAVTEPQLALMWRVADEPVIALDGDTAGMRAAERVIDLALPLLEAGKGLRFALMPDGQDPDDLIRAQGPGAVQAVLDAARPMVDVLWSREIAGRSFDSPERRAALDKALRARIAAIRDPSVRHHYGQAIKDLRWKLFRPVAAPRPAQAGGGGGRGRFPAAPMGPTEGAKRSLLGAAGEAVDIRLREAVVLAAILTAPDIAAEFDARLEAVDCVDPLHGAIRDAILRMTGDPQGMRAAVEAAVGAEALETLLAARHLSVVPCLRHPGDTALARQTVDEELGKLEAARGWLLELSEAEEDLDGLDDEALTWRLAEAARARDRAARLSDEDDAELEIGANGAPMARAERNALDSLLSRITFDKRRRKDL